MLPSDVADRRGSAKSIPVIVDTSGGDCHPEAADCSPTDSEDLDTEARAEFDALRNLDAPISVLPGDVITMTFEEGARLGSWCHFKTLVSYVAALAPHCAGYPPVVGRCPMCDVFWRNQGTKPRDPKNELPFFSAVPDHFQWTSSLHISLNRMARRISCS